MENINRWHSNQFQPPFYFESGQFDTKGLWLHSTNVVMSLNLKLNQLKKTTETSSLVQIFCLISVHKYIFHQQLILTQRILTFFVYIFKELQIQQNLCFPLCIAIHKNLIQDEWIEKELKKNWKRNEKEKEKSK